MEIPRSLSMGTPMHIHLEVRLNLHAWYTTGTSSWLAFITGFQLYTAIMLPFHCITAYKLPPPLLYA